MDHDFWHERWSVGEIGFHQADINSHLQVFWDRLDIAVTDPVFVPLCGKSRDMLWLRAQGHPVVGCELSPLAVSGFYAEHNLQPQTVHGVDIAGPVCHEAAGISVFCGDFFDLQPLHLQGVRAVYDRAALIALPAALRSVYVQHLQTIVPTGAPVLLVVIDYDQREMAGPPFAIAPDEVETLYGTGYRISLLHEEDLLCGGERERWQSRGITRMVERVYHLTPLPPASATA
jgi:thiopurine S-methyltransferase